MQGRLEKAEATFSRMRAEAPNHVYAWIGLGYCASLTDDPAKALCCFETAAAIGPADNDSAIACSDALSHLGLLDAARRVLAARPDSPGQRIACGALEERHGNHRDALIHYQAAGEADPVSDLPLRKMISLHRRCGEFAAALAMADRLAALGPQHEASAWHLKGQIHGSMGAREAATVALRTALDLSPLCEPILIDLARELRHLRREDEADGLLAGRPASYGILLARAELERARQNHDAALRHAAAAQAMDPARPDALERMARIEADRGDQAAAQAAADRILACGPAHRLTALRSRLASFRAAGEDRRARDTLVEMAALQPTDAGILSELAQQYRMTGDAAAARHMIQRALTQDPRSTMALTEAVEQASLAEDREGALDICRRMMAIAPDQVWSHLRVARRLHDLGRVEEAEAVLRAAEARFGSAADLWGERIRLLRETGQSYQALDMAREAQAAHPAHFGRWSDRFELELKIASVEAVRHCLDLAPAQSRAEVAQLRRAHARLALRLHDTDQALRHYQAALSLRPDNKSILNELFTLHLRELNLEQASAYQTRLAFLDAPSRRMRGATPNASQSHQGQLMNDLLIDRRAMADLAAIMASEPEQRITTLLSLVRKRPEHIPTAMALLVALRRGGWLNRPMEAMPGGRPPPVIPQSIGQFWDVADPPQDLLDLNQSWRAQNPDHHHTLFDDLTAQSYLASFFAPPVLLAYRRCADATIKADLFRLAFLFKDGGVWADMDDRCLAPVSDLIPAGVEAMFWQESTGGLCNNLMAAGPRHPVLRRALVTAVNAINRGDRDKVWMLTGPGLLSRAFAAEMAEAGELWPDWLGRMAIRNEFDIHPHVAIHCRTSHKRLGRHWSKTAFAQSERRSRMMSR